MRRDLAAGANLAEVRLLKCSATADDYLKAVAGGFQGNLVTGRQELTDRKGVVAIATDLGKGPRSAVAVVLVSER
jgi:hypothetical protein